jgi:hypothetical protein
MHKHSLPILAGLLAVGMFFSAPHAHAAGPRPALPATQDMATVPSPTSAPKPLRKEGGEGRESVESTFKESFEELEVFLRKHV